jgi:hypothetical protein
MALRADSGVAPDVLTRGDMDQLGCDNPRCRAVHMDLILSAPCHPKAGLVVVYQKQPGTLLIACKVCKQPVSLVQVGWGPQ